MRISCSSSQCWGQSSLSVTCLICGGNAWTLGKRRWQGQWQLRQCGLCQEVSAGLTKTMFLRCQSIRGVKIALECMRQRKFISLDSYEGEYCCHSFTCLFFHLICHSNNYLFSAFCELSIHCAINERGKFPALVAYILVGKQIINK